MGECRVAESRTGAKEASHQAAVATTHHNRGSQGQESHTREHGARERHETKQANSESQGARWREKLPAGARGPSPGRSGVPSRASRCVFAVRCVSKSPV